MSKILIIYSSVGGNTKLVCEYLEWFLLKKCEVSRQLVEKVSLENLTKNSFDLIILASPTYNQGTVESRFLPFLKDFKKLDFSGQKFAVIGLGDVRFYPEYLTESATVLEQNVKESEGELLLNSLRIGTDPLKMVKKLVGKWAEKILEKI